MHHAWWANETAVNASSGPGVAATDMVLVIIIIIKLPN
jgi:hypothetical protein